MLAGGSASLPGLTAMVTKQSGFACMVANPFEGMHIAESVGQKKMLLEAPSYLTACGLALRRFSK
jgi:type IV pilus assembly protein PilM